MKHEEATVPPAPLGQVERGVGRLESERDNVSVGGAERASESNSRHPADGDPYTTAHTQYKPRGCYECAWGKVPGCWRCGSR